jgi:hypothetical protein
MRTCARPCVCVCVSVRFLELSSTFRRRGQRVVRLAGVRLGVQREHRRVEHRASDDDVRGMCVRMYVRTALCTCSYRYCRNREADIPLGTSIVEHITDAHAPHMQTCARPCVWVCVSVRSENFRALPVGVDGAWFGLQTFYSASAFNANIGAWNTAAVTTLQGVCAASGRRRGCARPLFDAAYIPIFIYIYIRVYVGRHAPLLLWYTSACMHTTTLLYAYMCVWTHRRVGIRTCVHATTRTHRGTRNRLPIGPSTHTMVGGVRGCLYARAHSWLCRCMRGGLCVCECYGYIQVSLYVSLCLVHVEIDT